MKGWYIYVFLLFFFWSCVEKDKKKEIKTNVMLNTENTQPKDSILFSLLNPTQSGIKFVNHLTETVDMNGFFYQYYYNGAGVSISDINNDGLQDILFISNLRKNKLYLNQGNLNFKDITEKSGLGLSSGYRTGVTNVDINYDGFMDYYISKSGKYDDVLKLKNELWVNQGLDKDGIPIFKEDASKYGLDIAMCSTQAAFFDYDLDGDLDMFLINHYPSPLSYTNINQLEKKRGILTGDRLFQNRNGKYIDVTQKAGLTNTSRLSYGLGISIGDVNNDGWPDVYVANDYEGKDFLYLNNKNGTFKDVANDATAHVSFYSMGTDMADINNDGYMDFISLDMMSEDNYGTKISMSAMNTDKFSDVVDRGLHNQYMYNALQINNGVSVEKGIPIFSDIAQLSGVSNTDWSWGPLFFDMNNDGYKDIFVSNGIKRDFRNNDFVLKHKTNTEKIKHKDRDAFIKKVLNEMPVRKRENYFFKNNGDLSFEKKNGKWLVDFPTSSNGAAYGDLDNDGDLDLVVNNMDDVSLIYKNNSIEQGLGNYIKIKIEGSPKNINGIGTRVELHYGKKAQFMEHYLTRGFQSAIGTGLHFGLGENKTIKLLRVIWPNGKQQELKNIPVNQEIVVRYKDAKKNVESKIEKKNKLFTTIATTDIGLNWKHRENDFDDFKRERLLPHRMSQFGPALAIGDFDGDQRQDVFLGGAKDQAPKLYRQNEKGVFKPVQESLFRCEKKYEDIDALFVDADNDGDLDIYVVSGGNEASFPSHYYQDRLYENIEGVFSYNKEALPSFFSSGSCVRAIDYDDDGDEDLFIGGRQLPGQYPMPAKSYLLRNDSKEGKIKYTDVTNTVFQELDNIGMVTDALCIDLDGDKKEDIILVGEWMSIRLFHNNDNKFKEVTEENGFENTKGWWNAIRAADFDNDGDLDLIAGNLGMNYKYKATVEKPFKVFGNDFDKTGTFDIVLGYYEGNNLYPLRGRQCSSEQMPFIKNKFPSYDAFGKASLEDVYGAKELDKSIKYDAQTFATTYFENRGDGTFISRVLDNVAQITSVNDIIINDFDKDGNLDLLLAGNLYGSEVETPRNDAGIGIYMRGDGKGNFIPIPMYKSGLFVPGEVRHIKKMSLPNIGNVLVFAINNDSLQVVKYD